MTKLARPWSLTALVGFGVWLLLLVTNPGRNETLDVHMRVLVARQMWSSFSISLPPATDVSWGPWMPAADGRWVAPYGIGQSLVLVPFDAMGVALARGAPTAIEEYVRWLPIGLGLLPVIGVLWWYVSFKLLVEWGLSSRTALVGATAMHLGTIAFHYSGQGQEEALVGLLLSCCLWFVFRARKSLRYRDAVLAGLFAGACLITRPVSLFALSALPFIGWTLKARWTKALGLAVASGVTVGAVGLVGLFYNAARFGTVFSVGYDRLGHFAQMSLDDRAFGILGALLIGPGVGLFVLSPVLLFALWSQRVLWRTDRAYLVGFWVAVCSCFLFFSSWHDSHTGGTAWGTRYQCHLLSMFALPVTLGLRAAWQSRTARGLVVAVVAVSGVFQLASVTITNHLEGYQFVCSQPSDQQFETGLRRGQLGRRLENIGRWVVGLPAAAEGASLACRENVDKMWERYIPNFWGPVFARRLESMRLVVLALWGCLVVATAVVLGTGVRKLVGVHRDTG